MAFESFTFGMYFNDCAKYIAYIFDTVFSLFICLTNVLGGLLITLLGYYSLPEFSPEMGFSYLCCFGLRLICRSYYKYFKLDFFNDLCYM